MRRFVNRIAPQRQQQDHTLSSSSILKKWSTYRATTSSEPKIIQLAKKKRFALIKQLLDDPSKANELLHECVLSHNGTLNFFEDASPLHMIMMFQPPVDLIDLLIRRIVQYSPYDIVPEESLNRMGQTPLHIAVQYRCAPSIVRRLLAGRTHILPAVILDSNDRTPLHLACMNDVMETERTTESYSLKGIRLSFISSSGRWRSSSKLLSKVDEADTTTKDERCRGVVGMGKVLGILCRAYPEAAGIKDCHGHTPLDYASNDQTKHIIITELESCLDASAAAGKYEEDKTDTVDCTVTSLTEGSDSHHTDSFVKEAATSSAEATSTLENVPIQNKEKKTENDETSVLFDDNNSIDDIDDNEGCCNTINRLAATTISTTI